MRFFFKSIDTTTKQKVEFTRNLILASLAAIGVFTSLHCNSNADNQNPLVNQEPTPFDSSTFIGTYKYLDDTTSYRLAGKIGSNGLITELQTEENGLLRVNGSVNPAGELNFNANYPGLSSMVSMNFFGFLILDNLGPGYFGQGDWSGSIKTSTSHKEVNGNWEIHLDTTTLTFSTTGNFLCWTGTTDSLRKFKLLRMNGKTGEVSVVGGEDYFTQLVYGPDNILYGIGSKLCIIDPATGERTLIGDLSIPGSSGSVLMSGAEFSPDGILYTVENGGKRIFTVDLSTGLLTLVGTTTLNTRDVAFSKVGTLYAGSTELAILNSVTMATLNSVGSDLYLGGSMFFTQSGTLVKNDCFPSTNLYSINLETGKAKAVLALGSTGIGAIVEERVFSISSVSLLKNRRENSHVADFPQEYLEKLEKAHKNGISMIDF